MCLSQGCPEGSYKLGSACYLSVNAAAGQIVNGQNEIVLCETEELAIEYGGCVSGDACPAGYEKYGRGCVAFCPGGGCDIPQDSSSCTGDHGVFVPAASNYPARCDAGCPAGLALVGSTCVHACGGDQKMTLYNPTCA